MTPLRTLAADFIQSDHGAVTVDMVPLMAATVGLGLAVLGVVSGGVENASADIETALVQQDITTEFAQPEQQVIRIRARVTR